MNTEELRKYYIDNHRKMWNWLADNPDKNKKDWPGWKKHDYVTNNCFICGYCEEYSKDCDMRYIDKFCDLCPLDWEITNDCGLSSYYNKWNRGENRARMARKIANLKENMTNKSDTKDEVIETKEMTISVLFSDFSTYPNLAVKIQRLIIKKEIKFVDVKPTHYIVRGMELLLKSIYK